jgi:hypothetical protein
MKDDTALMYARLSQYDSWEQQEEKSYDIKELREEYRNRLYSEDGLRMIEEARRPEDRTNTAGQ